MKPLELELLDDLYAICRMDGDASIPAWAKGPFLSLTRFRDELSVVCPQSAVPIQIPCEREWRCIRIAGPLALSMTGIISSLSGTLAAQGVSVFVISTYDTDYILVREDQRAKAIHALLAAGHILEPAPKGSG